MTPVFRAKIKNSAISFLNKEMFGQHMAGFSEGEMVAVTVERVSSLCSPPQMRYYFHCVELIADYTGENKKKEHENLKEMFGVDSVRNLETPDMKEYIQKVIAFAQVDLGVKFPEREEVK